MDFYTINIFRWCIENIFDAQIFPNLANGNPFLLAAFSFFFSFLFFFFLPCVEVPRLGVESELQLPAYTTATATPDLSELHLLPTLQLEATLDHG